tara:strand:- start:362 stop:1171 length:810 start_codon:yes stop_codon:yes gene_type:complete
MELHIKDEQKACSFVKIFKNMHLISEYVSITFYPTNIYIQGIENSKSAIFELKLDNSWFTNYNINNSEININMNCNILSKVFGIHAEKEAITICLEPDDDNLYIIFKSENDFKKDLKIPLMDDVCNNLNITNIDYDVEFSMKSKTLASLLDKLNTFGNTVKIKCNESQINLYASDVDGQLTCILYDSNEDSEYVDEFSCVENIELNVSYGMKMFVNFCTFEKVNTNVYLSFSENKPMKLSYKLDDYENEDIDNCKSELNFFLAPKLDID